MLDLVVEKITSWFNEKLVCKEMKTCLPITYIGLSILQISNSCVAGQHAFIMPEEKGFLTSEPLNKNTTTHHNKATKDISLVNFIKLIRDDSKHAADTEIENKDLDTSVKTNHHDFGIKEAGEEKLHKTNCPLLESSRALVHDTSFNSACLKPAKPNNIATIESHKNHVLALAVCGDLLYTASESKDIRVCRAPMFEELDCFGSGTGAVQSLMAFQEFLYSAHQDNKIRVWKRVQSSDRRSCRHKLVAVLPRLEHCVKSMLSQSNYVQVRRHKRKLWIEHADRISALALGGSRNTTNEGGGSGPWQPSVLYSASWDKTVKVWSLNNFKCVESFHAHHDAINAMVVIDGSVLATASADCTIKLWTKMSYPTRKKKHGLIGTMEGQKAAVNALAMSSNSKVMYSGGADGTVMAWKKVYSSRGRKGRISRGNSLGKQSSGNSGGILSRNVSGELGSNIIGCSGGSGEIISRANSLTTPGLSNIKKVISYHNRLHAVSTNSINFVMKKALVGHARAVLSVSSVGDNLVCSSSADTTIRVWVRAHAEMRRRWEYACIGVLAGHGAPVKAIASVKRPTSQSGSCHDHDANQPHVAEKEEVDEAGVIVYSGGLDSKVKVWALNIRPA